MKFLTIIFLKILLSSYFLMANTIPTKSKILKQSSECIKDSQKKECGELISKLEKLQLEVYDQNRFKCQSSLLGLQSELIETYFFKNSSEEKISFMIPYVNKTC